MYKHILIAIDGSQLAEKALRVGLALAKQLGSAVTVATVTEDWSPLEMATKARIGAYHPVEDYDRKMAEQATHVLEGAGAIAAEIGVGVATHHTKHSDPADGIIEVAKERGCDLIVMSSHGRRGAAKLLLGSVASKVLTYSAIPVMICR